MNRNVAGGTARDLVRDLTPLQEWGVVQGTPLSRGPQDSRVPGVGTDFSTR